MHHRIYGYVIVLGLLCHACWAVNHVYDEFVWTKESWDSFKIEYPLQNYNPTDGESIRAIGAPMKDLIKSAKHTSLDGPMPRREGSPFMGYSEEQSLMDVVDDADMADHAAEAVKCTVCQTIITHLWDHAVIAVNQGKKFGESDAELRLAGACQSRVIEEVLSRQAIYKMEAQAGTAVVVFFVVRDRRKGSERTLPEEIAVNKACQMLSQERSRALVSAVLEAAEVYSQRLAHIRASATEPEDEYLDEEDEEGEAADTDCVDLHHMCPAWARIGECDANPNYMVGSAGLRGHCRRSCGVCTPRLDLKGSVAALKLTAVGQEQLEAARQALLQQLRDVACRAAKACIGGASATSDDGGILQIKTSSNAWQLGKPFFGRARLAAAPEQDPQQAAAAAKVVQAAARSAAAAAASGSGPAASAAADSAAVEDSAAGALLAGELGGQMASIPDDFFLYQLVFRSHIRQFHEEGGDVTEDWLLGRYSGEEADIVDSTTGKPAVLDKLDLLPDMGMAMGKWPYMKQMYTKGDVCTLQGGRQVARSVEVRYACSPDGRLRMLVREPDFCTYIFVVYSPALCKLDRYKPTSGKY